MLDHDMTIIRKEAMWTLSNVTAGSSDQIQAVIDTGAFPKIVHMLRTAEPDIQKEAKRVMDNVTSVGTTEQIAFIENLKSQNLPAEVACVYIYNIYMYICCVIILCHIQPLSFRVIVNCFCLCNFILAKIGN